MKKDVILFLLLITGMLTGCIKDNMDDCHRSYTLLFRYTGDGTTDIFRQKVTKVDLYVYNAETKQLVETYTVDRAALEQLQGITFDNLAPGNYEAVCWGNAGEHSLVDKCENKEQGSIASPEYYGGTSIATNDELYHAVKSFTISRAWEDVKETCDFTCAHINLKVRMEGFENMFFPLTKGTSDTCPVGLRMTSLAGCCHFNGEPSETLVTYTPETVRSAESETAYEAVFCTLRFEDENDIELQLINPATSEPFHTLSMEKYLADNNLSVVDKQEVELSILIRFENGGVGITVQPFKEEDIHPGLDEKKQETYL